MSQPRQLVLILVACLLLRLPSLRYDVLSDDEAIYDSMARVVMAGGVMYRDTIDRKPPGLVYTYALAERVAVGLGGRPGGLGLDLVHLLGMAVAAATCLALYQIARRLLAAQLVLLPPLFYAVSSTAMQPVDALAVNGELLMNLPTALAVLAALQGRLAWDMAAGALCGVATLFKWQAGVTLICLPALAEREDRWRRCAAWAVGFALPLVLAAGFFTSRGALADALHWGLLENAGYISQGPGLAWALSRLGIRLLTVVLPAGLVFVGGISALLRGLPDVIAGQRFLSLWGWLSLASVLLGGRFFGHYFLQPELPLTLLAAGPAWRLSRARRAVALIVPALPFFLLASFPKLSRPLLNPRDPDYHAIGREIAARTRDSDSIWVWGNVPQLYFGSDRLAGVRFPFCNYLTGLSPGTPSEYDDSVHPRANAIDAWDLVVSDLDRNRPALVLDTSEGNMKGYGKLPISAYPTLDAYLRAHYRREGAVLGVGIYRRASTP